MAKMSLIVFGETGHVLGVFTRTADPEGATTAEQVVGDGLVLREPGSGDPRVRVREQHLKVETIDHRDEVILSHGDYVFEDGVPMERAEISGGGGVAYDRTTKTLTVTVTNSLAEDGEAWVQIENDQDEPIVIPVEMAAGTNSGTSLATLAPGEYGVLVLAPEHRTFLGTLSVV